jgi:hypothetical protein
MSYTKDMKTKDETITQIINQYEDKMRRLSDENEKNEKKISTLNEKIKKTLKEIEEIKSGNDLEKRKYEQSIRETIVSSSEIVIQMKNSLEVDLSDDNLQDEVFDKIKEMIVNITKVNDDNKWVHELRGYISRTLLSYLDTIFKQINSDKNFAGQKLKWQTTLDQISLSHEEELKKSKFFL